MPRTTDPLANSAPLPEDWPIRVPEPHEIVKEIKRASAELMWALHRQRQAWAKMARVKAELGARNIDYVDNERPWKLATGDVSWWRGEVSSRSNALSSLLALAAALNVQLPGRRRTDGTQ